MVDVIGRYSKPRGLEKDLGQLLQIVERATRNSSAQSEPTPTKIRNIVRRLGRQRIDQLVAAYKQGRTTIELMNEYGLSKASVIHLLEGNDVAMRRQPLTSERLEAAIQSYEDGHSLAAIEKIVNIPHESIRRELAKAGVTMRPRGGPRARPVRAPNSP